MKTKKEYNFLSPDGFPINFENYPTKEDAENDLIEWVKRFERQGYYSSNNGRISLDEVASHCQLITVDL